MAITVYIGNPGSGKSYEVVRNVIIPAICSGRRVVTNVYGISYENIIKYCEDNKLLKEGVIQGELIPVENDRIMQPYFFPVEGKQDKSLCKPGDLVILDECHRFFLSDRAIPEDVRIFAAEHRHYVDSVTGFTCDLILVNQGMTLIPRFLKERIEQTFRMKKLHALAGFGNKYRVDVFDGTKQTKDSRITYYIESYKKDIFPLYKSHHAPGAIEVKADGRGVVFKKTTVLLYLFFLLISLFLFWHYTIPFFFPDWNKKEVNNESSQVNNKTDVVQSQQYQRVQKEEQATENSRISDWCIIGQIRKKTGRYIFLKDSTGRVRMVSAYGFTGSGQMMEGIVDGNKVVVWSCNPVIFGVSRGIL
ncbi:zonular occludens toxin [Salmonella enterica subsp. enterica]|nr:zonular occludens toxin [Salmonella enterica subsp. enterica serovar Rubislaw]EDK1585459.1 zonular occludens toxin [Salmonella enterica subsp. enterica serovar Rubislaw]